MNTYTDSLRMDKEAEKRTYHIIISVAKSFDCAREHRTHS